MGDAMTVFDEPDYDDNCPNCGGLKIVPGCFGDTCCGAGCDPEDAEYCCAPSRCDWCQESSPIRDETEGAK